MCSRYIIKLYIVWDIPCCKCDSTAGEGMTVSLFAYNLFLRAKVKASPKLFAASLGIYQQCCLWIPAINKWCVLLQCHTKTYTPRNPLHLWSIHNNNCRCAKLISRPDYVCKTVKVILEWVKQTRNYLELVCNQNVAWYACEAPLGKERFVRLNV